MAGSGSFGSADATGFFGITARTSGGAFDDVATDSVSPARVAIMKSTSVAERSSSGVNCTSMPGGWRASPSSFCTRLTVPRPCIRTSPRVSCRLKRTCVPTGCGAFENMKMRSPAMCRE